MALEFRAAARMDDRLIVESAAARIGGASVSVRQRILRDAAVLLEAEVQVALVGGGRPIRLPDDLVARLSAAVTGP